MDEVREPTYLMLCSLAEGSKHGYAIRQDVETVSDGRVSLRAGTLYAALDRLVESGWIERTGHEVVGGRMRYYYGLTDAGRSALAQAAEVRRRQARLATSRLKRAALA